MTWRTLKRKAAVGLKRRAPAPKGKKPIALKFSYFVAVQVGEPADYASHWTKQGMDAANTLKRILNTKNAHDATEHTAKKIVRDTVLAVEAEITKANKDITDEALLVKIAADERVKTAIETHDKEARQFIIGNTRGADGSITKTKAAKAIWEMLQKDPEAVKAFAKKQGIEL
jgi:hypothetical protein